VLVIPKMVTGRLLDDRQGDAMGQCLLEKTLRRCLIFSCPTLAGEVMRCVWSLTRVTTHAPTSMRLPVSHLESQDLIELPAFRCTKANSYLDAVGIHAREGRGNRGASRLRPCGGQERVYAPKHSLRLTRGASPKSKALPKSIVSSPTQDIAGS
jgi:hypothetical protein